MQISGQSYVTKDSASKLLEAWKVHTHLKAVWQIIKKT